MNLKNKKVIITGATGGIGNSLVEKFNNLGATIMATGTNEDKLNNLKKNIKTLILRNLNQMSIIKLKVLLKKRMKNQMVQIFQLTMPV